MFTRPLLICIEILSKDDRLRDMRERADDYLTLGVLVLRKAYVCTKSAFQEPASGILEVAGTEIRVPLHEIFAELD